VPRFKSPKRIFARLIRGSVTMWSGFYSQMAVQAAGLDMPAAIRAGKALFHARSSAKVLVLDCSNRQVRVVR